ncbi:MAG TPA: hypothetical protein DDW98_06695, partial [Gammaproteobacteria bacterium]|nr:hypothetical protein [Gammaproteobacteria bacterium]
MPWWTLAPLPPDAAAGEAATARWNSLTKPPGSLGRLERADAASIAAHYGSVSVGTY